jgi:hypothetical protein
MTDLQLILISLWVSTWTGKAARLTMVLDVALIPPKFHTFIQPIEDLTPRLGNAFDVFLVYFAR